MRKKAVLLAASASVASGKGGGKKTFGSTWCAVCLSLKSRRSSCSFSVRVISLPPDCGAGCNARTVNLTVDTAGYAGGPAPALRMTRGSSSCVVSMQADAPVVSRKSAVLALGLALPSVLWAPRDAAAFVENFYVPGVSDGAGGSISKTSKKAMAPGGIEDGKPPPPQVLALEAEGEEVVETEWGPYTKKARDAAKKKGTGNLKCRAAIGGGQTCEGSAEVS